MLVWFLLLLLLDDADPPLLVLRPLSSTTPSFDFTSVSVEEEDADLGEEEPDDGV